ncbi:MAG TPA: DUF3617 family protein [Thermoanaerobaculia bacterium]|nr:DUF3617 family protein [Thermoanaerobaculia bacterium]
MTRTVALLVLTTALAAASAFAAAAPRFRPGLWELETSTPGSKLKPQVVQRCYAAADVGIANGTTAEANAFAKKDANMKALEQKGCKMKELRIAGDEVIQTFQCASYSMKDVTTYHRGDTFDSVLTVDHGNGRLQTSLTKGRRVSDCVK